MVLSSNSGVGNRFFTSPKRLNWPWDTPNWPWDTPNLSFHKCQSSFPGLQQPRIEVDSLL